MIRQLVFAIMLLSLLFNNGMSQTKFNLSGTIGYFAPLGDWQKHMYAEGVNQFQGGYSMFPEAELKFKDVALSVIFNYSKMSATDWEEFVSEEGADIIVSASQSQIGGVVKYYFVNSQPHLFDFEAGAVYLFLKGTEQFHSYSYEYDFLNSGFAILSGLGYQFSLNDRLSIILPIRVLWRPEGIQFSDGRSLDIFGLYITPGLKFIF
ncbi:MAG: hypothetical protein HUU32_02370 [Calditrichaceae bacterium]|nr:hypothetical protein [Calditrichia bacterium]NUQ40222.1 hypothetical protein [Calditrichaceae bacterium]